MNALKLSMLDSVILLSADHAAPAAPVRVRTGISPLTGPSAVLWRQSLAAHEPATSVRWTVRGCYALLGTLSVASIAYALLAICQGVLAHDGLQAAVQSLMSR